MSTSDPEFDLGDYEGLQPKQVTLHPAELRKLRKQAQRAEDLEARIADLERREMFAKAGIPLDDPAAKYFVKGYDGELSPEAIKAAAVEAKILAQSPTSPAEIAGHQAVSNAAAGAQNPSAHPDFAAQLAELGKKHFAPTDDAGRNENIQAIARLQREAAAAGLQGARIPVY